MVNILLRIRINQSHKLFQVKAFRLFNWVRTGSSMNPCADHARLAFSGSAKAPSCRTPREASLPLESPAGFRITRWATQQPTSCFPKVPLSPSSPVTCPVHFFYPSSTPGTMTTPCGPQPSVFRIPRQAQSWRYIYPSSLSLRGCPESRTLHLYSQQPIFIEYHKWSINLMNKITWEINKWIKTRKHHCNGMHSAGASVNPNHLPSGHPSSHILNWLQGPKFSFRLKSHTMRTTLEWAA